MELVIDRYNELDFGLQCILCKHRSMDYRGGCEAFPDGIPASIAQDVFDHHMPYAGDHGIQFEAIEPHVSQDIIPDDILVTS